MKLYLVSSKKAEKLLSEISDTKVFYLDNDYLRLLQLQKYCTNSVTILDLGDLLAEKANLLRRPYLDYIGSLSVKYNSLAWWISRVTEKNSMVSPVFLYICYLSIIKDMLKQEQPIQNVCVISKSSALLTTISRLPASTKYEVSYLSENDKFLRLLKIFARIGFFLWQSIKRKYWAIRTRAENSINTTSKPVTIIRTWVTDRCLSENGEFHDNYFQTLSQMLIDSGRSIVIFPLLYNMVMPISQSFAWFRKSSQQFLIPEDYYNFSDYIYAIMHSIKSIFLFWTTFKFESLDITQLFREEALRCGCEVGQLDFAMQSRLPLRLKKKQISIEKYIYTFENMFPEKPFLIGIANDYSNIQTIGFQHSVLFPLLLSLYSSVQEQVVLPLPDKIVCSGKFFRETLAKEGFSSDILVEGPALRFQYLLKNREYLPISNERKNRILITLPLAESNAMELLAKVSPVLAERPELSIIIKPHPMMLKTKLDYIIGKVAINIQRVTFDNSSMLEVLQNVGLVIATASGTIYDALAFGIPVLRIEQDLDINLDPMDWFSNDSFQYIARTPDKIATELDLILKLSDPEHEQLHNYGQTLINKTFNPINMETLKYF